MALGLLQALLDLALPVSRVSRIGGKANLYSTHSRMPKETISQKINDEKKWVSNCGIFPSSG